MTISGRIVTLLRGMLMSTLRDELPREGFFTLSHPSTVVGRARAPSVARKSRLALHLRRRGYLGMPLMPLRRPKHRPKRARHRLRRRHLHGQYIRAACPPGASRKPQTPRPAHHRARQAPPLAVDVAVRPLGCQLGPVGCRTALGRRDGDVNALGDSGRA